MLVWIVYVMLVSMTLSLAAFMLERTALLRRVPTRWVWVVSIIACLLLPVIISSASLPLPSILWHNLPALPSQSFPLRQMTSTELSPAIWLNNTIGPAGTRADTGNLLQHAWFITSAAMLLVLVTGIVQLHICKHSWTCGMICDAPVYIAEDVGPAIVGLFRPRIVVPCWLVSCPPEDQKLVILHETSHLDARDAQLLAFALFLIATMPWNLPLWWQLKRLRYAIEVDCDARVLQRGQDISLYGNVLITVGARQSRNIGVVAAMSESGSFLEHRIHHMLRTPRRVISLSVVTAACLAFCFATVAAQIRPPNAISLDKSSREVVTEKDVLDQYAGYYHIFNNIVLTITRNGDQLLAQVSGGPPVPIFPSAPGKFFYKVANIQLSFISGGQGEVSAVDVCEDGYNQHFTRIDSAAAKQYADMLAAKIHSQAPDPRSKTALLRILNSMKTDKPDYRGVPPGAVALAQKEIFGNKKLMHDVASFKDSGSLKFSNVTPEGGDVYQLKLGNTTWYFDIYLDNDGNVVGFNPWVRRAG